MIRRAGLPALLLCLAACSDTTAPAVEFDAVPAASFGNGPAVLPNIFRTADGIGGWVPDPRTGLLAYGGLPTDPTQSTECGGTEPFDVHEIQLVGLKREELNLLAKSRDVSLTVYDLDSFTDFCTSTPLAQGRGRITLAIRDDFAVSGSSTIAVTLTGPVQLADGGRAHLIVQALIQTQEAGVYPFRSTTVRLTRN